jgi:hypothetical protein
MSSPADLAFHERLARDLLEREGPDVICRLHSDAIEADRAGHSRGAQLLIETAEAAWRLLGESTTRRCARR